MTMAHKKVARKKQKNEAVTLPAEPAARIPRDLETRDERTGDLQGLSDSEVAGPESVRELTAEGQYFEAALASAVEDAPPADAGPLKTRERKADDVPREYTDHPADEPREE